MIPPAINISKLLYHTFYLLVTTMIPPSSYSILEETTHVIVVAVRTYPERSLISAIAQVKDPSSWKLAAF